MATISPTPKLQFLDANGDPLSYGLLYTYIAGTTTSKTTYTTAAQTTANTNPILLDSRGQADVWLLAGEAYKFTLQNSSGVLQYTVDQITAAGTMSTQNANAVAITGGTISGVTITGTITANVIGNVTGNVTGNLTGNVTGNLTGNVTAGTVVADSYNGGQLAGLRNKIINGNFNIWQRGTSFAGQTPTASSATTVYADRWRVLGQGTTAVLTIARSADVPNNQTLYSNSIEVTTADVTVNSADYYYFYQPIEGFNIRDLYGKTFTLSFWVKSSKTGTHCVSLRATSNSPIYIAQYTVNVADTWEFKTITVVDGLPGGTGSWTWDSGMGLRVGWVLQAGSTYNAGTANSWYSSAFDYATSDQVNVFDTVGNTFKLANVQLEVGTVDTPFEHRTSGLELSLCQRYYEKSFVYATAPAQNVGSSLGAAYATGQVNNQTFSTLVGFCVTKRAAPTITTYAPDAATANWSTNTTTPTAATANIGESSFALAGTTSVTAGNSYSIHWAASAELT